MPGTGAQRVAAMEKPPLHKDPRFWQAAGLGLLTTLAVAVLAVFEAATGRLLHTLILFGVLPLGAVTFGALAASGLCGWLVRGKTKPAAGHYLAAAALGAIGLPLCYVSIYLTSHVDAPHEAKALKAELESLREKGRSQKSEVDRLSGEVAILRSGLGRLASGGRELAEYSRLAAQREKVAEAFRAALEQFNAYGLGAGTFSDKRAGELKAEAERLRAELERVESGLSGLSGRVQGLGGKTPSLTDAVRAAEEHNKLLAQLKLVRGEFEENARRYAERSVDYRPLAGKYELNQSFRGEHLSVFLRRSRGSPYGLRTFLRESFRARSWSILSVAPRVASEPPAGPVPFRAWAHAALETLGFLAGAAGLVLFLDRKYFVTELIECGGCGKKLRVPTWKGSIRVRCPNCRRETAISAE